MSGCRASSPTEAVEWMDIAAMKSRPQASRPVSDRCDYPSVLRSFRDEGREGGLPSSRKLLLKISAGSEMSPEPSTRAAALDPPIRKFRDAVKKDRGERNPRAPVTDEILAVENQLSSSDRGVPMH